MKTLFRSILLLLLIAPMPSDACDCIYLDNFCENLTYDNDGHIHDNWSIHHVKITATHSTGVNVSVIKTYHGADLEGTSAFIHSGNGADCQIFTDTFSINGEYIVSTTISSLSGQWWVTSCGISYLKVENDVVSGQITPGLTQVPLRDFTSITMCGEMVVTPNQGPVIEPEITVLPTLATHLVAVKTSSPGFFDLSLTVFDASGKLVFKDRKRDFNSNVGIDIETVDWSNGVYFFRVNVAGKSNTVKIVKQEP